MKIKAYLKPHCGWSMGVRAIMEKYSLDYEDLDIINNREIYEEMVTKSGQPLSPCVEVDDVMLADVSGEEVENYLLSNNLVYSCCGRTNKSFFLSHSIISPFFITPTLSAKLSTSGRSWVIRRIDICFVF